MMARRTFGRVFGRGVLSAVLGGAVLALWGCNPFTSDANSYRFKMTVEVDTPQGLRTSMSVYEVAATSNTDLITGGTGSSAETRGEAVAVDIAPGRTLFALLKTSAHFEDMASLSMQTLDPEFTQRYDTIGTAMRLAQGGPGQAAEVAPAIYPMLVTFTDIRDPKSVTRVDPADMAATFGAGVKLRRIIVQVTDEAVTTGIGERFSWWQKYEAYDYKKSGPFYKNFPSEVMALRSK